MNMVRRQTDTKKKKKTKYLKKTFPGTTSSTKNPSLQCQICGGQGSTETDLSLHFPSQYHSASAPYSFMHLPLTLDHLSNWVHHSIKHLKKVLNQSPISEGYTFIQNFWNLSFLIGEQVDSDSGGSIAGADYSYLKLSQLTQLSHGKYWHRRALKIWQCKLPDCS